MALGRYILLRFSKSMEGQLAVLVATAIAMLLFDLFGSVTLQLQPASRR